MAEPRDRPDLIQRIQTLELAQEELKATVNGLLKVAKKRNRKHEALLAELRASEESGKAESAAQRTRVTQAQSQRIEEIQGSYFGATMSLGYNLGTGEVVIKDGRWKNQGAVLRVCGQEDGQSADKRPLMHCRMAWLAPEICY